MTGNCSALKAQNKKMPPWLGDTQVPLANSLLGIFFFSKLWKQWNRDNCLSNLPPLGCQTCSNHSFNTLRLRQNGRHFADDIFKWIFLNENVWIPIQISRKFVPQSPIHNIPSLVQIMAWRRPGDKPLSGPMMVRLPKHICVTRPQWVNMC